MRFSLPLLAFLGLATAAHATTFSLPTGSTAQIGGSNYTMTGTVSVNASNEITGGTFTIDGLPAVGDTTFNYLSDSIQGGGNNRYDIANFGNATDATSTTIYYSSLVLYTLPDLKNGNIVICDGPCSSGTDSAVETSAIGLSFAGSPYSFQGTFGGSLVPQVTTSVAATPEPSSLLLLGTGILGVAGATRRRFAKR